MLRLLPELVISFEHNPEFDIYLYVGWLFWGVELQVYCGCGR